MSDNSIILSAYSNVGVVIGTVTINGNIVYGTDWYSSMYNQNVVETLDNGEVCSGTSELKRIGKIVMKSLTYSEGIALKDFLETDLKYRGYYLGININGASLDIGKGLGVNIVYSHKCKLIDINGESLLNRRAPGDYDVTFRYRFPI